MLDVHPFVDSLRASFEWVADFFLPRFCLFCGPSVPSESLPNLCDTCLANLQLSDGREQCRLCAMPLSGLLIGRGRCLGCFRRRSPWQRVVALGPFDGLLADMIRRLKFNRERAFAAPLGELMASQAQSIGWSHEDLDGIVPIPLSAARERHRGFNQAQLVGNFVSKALQVPMRPEWLSRIGAESSQVGRGAKRRRMLGKRVFRCAPQVFGKRLLIVDDVMTTQATLRAAAGALKAEGALEIQVLICARTALNG